MKTKKEKKEKAETTKPKSKSKTPASGYQKKYQEECRPLLMKEFGFKNVMECPRLQKIVINTSIKEAVDDKKILTKVAEDLGVITGQRPVLTKAKKSISNFKLREGQPIGCTVTLRRQRMYEFLNRFVNVALPRVRDFKGVPPKGFDGRGNYTLGLTEQTLFSEIPYEKVEKVYGMSITFVTTAKTNAEGKALLKGMGMPFRE